MSKSCPLHLLLCGRYGSFHTSMLKVRFNLQEKNCANIQWILMYVSVVKYSISYGLQCVLSNSEKEKTEFTKITLRNTKATLPFAIITMLSNKAFIVDTQVYMNWNENFKTNVFIFSALDWILPARRREKQCFYFIIIFFCNIFCQNCNQMNMKPYTILASLAFPCWITLINDFFSCS